jgi:hypothetical protein
MTDIPICGLRTPEGVCTESREPTEGAEAGELFGGQTYRPRCSDHRGMPADVRPEPGPFAAQHPSFEPAAQVREALVRAVMATLEESEERGNVSINRKIRSAEMTPDSARRRLASRIVDDLATDALAKTLQGMAIGQVQP